MARKKAGLTAAVIDNECNGHPNKKEFYPHGQFGLSLAVDRRYADPGRKTFVFEAKIDGRTFRRVLGEWPAWTVPQATKAARELRVKIDNGIDPRAEDRARRDAADQDAMMRSAQQATLSDAWDAYLAWRAQSTRPLAKLTIRDYNKHMRGAFADWAKKKLTSITGAAVVTKHRTLIAANKSGKSGQADQAMRYLRAVLNYALELDQFKASFPNGNPVRKLTKEKAWGKPVAKTRTLEKSQLRAWWTAVDSLENPVMAAYLRFLVLTGCRRDEALELAWTEVDLRWNSITFLAIKTGGDRVIPLTDYLRQMLNGLIRINGWVFPSTLSKSGHLTEPAKAIDRIEAMTGLRVSSHDLRRSFSNLSEWAGIPDGAVRNIMGHKPGTDVHEGHYKYRQLDVLTMFLQRYENFIRAEVAAVDADGPQGPQAVEQADGNPDQQQRGVLRLVR